MTYTQHEVDMLVAEHGERLREQFSKECERFHAEGHKCVTCGREDLDKLVAEARLTTIDEVRVHVSLFMPTNDDESHYQRSVLSILEGLRSSAKDA